MEPRKSEDASRESLVAQATSQGERGPGGDLGMGSSHRGDGDPARPARGRRLLPGPRNGFVIWDDDANFLGNPHYRGLGRPQVRWAWTTFHAGVYQPLGWMTLERNTPSSDDPRGYHLIALLEHAAAAVRVHVLTSALLVRCRPDVFLEHPGPSVGPGLASAMFAVTR